MKGSGGMVSESKLQAGANGNGQWFNPNATNTTLELHNNEKVNFLTHDGHLEIHHPDSENVIDTGTIQM